MRVSVSWQSFRLRCAKDAAPHAITYAPKAQSPEVGNPEFKSPKPYYPKPEMCRGRHGWLQSFHVDGVHELGPQEGITFRV